MTKETRIAGSDTTSTTATFTLLLLVNNPDKLKKAIQELDVSFPAKDDPITFAKTQDLPYLNAVINESMRVMPIVTLGMRSSFSLSQDKSCMFILALSHSLKSKSLFPSVLLRTARCYGSEELIMYRSCTLDGRDIYDFRIRNS